MTSLPAGDGPLGPQGCAGPAATGGRRAGGGQSGDRYGAPAMSAALEPVRAAMLRRARSEAEQIIARARGQAADTLARARREADEQVAGAREAARAQIGPAAAGQLSKARRDAAQLVLRARSEALADLQRKVGEQVAQMRDEPGHDELVSRLATAARETAGPGAVLTRTPDGGVVARGPGVVVDCSLARLAQAAVDALGARVEALWAPGRPSRATTP